ncbi:MAG: YcaO-like family protein [Haloarculaceae archaeon]
MHVGLVGDGPAVATLEATLTAADCSLSTLDPDAAGDADLAVVVGDAGTAAVDRATAVARAAGTRHVTVELGGLGGHPLADVDAAITGFDPETACFECLRGRVAANDPEPGASGADDATARLAGALAGRELAAVVEGDGVEGDEDPFGRVLELPHARRPLLALPNCTCAADHDWTVRRDATTRPLEAAVTAAERALDSRVGVVASVGELESFPVPYYLAELCDTSGFSDATAPRQAAGVATDWNGAMMKALGEALERYSGAIYRDDDFQRAPPAAVPDGVAPSAFVCSPAFDAPAADEAIRWVPGADLHSGESAWLPAEFVHFPPPEHRHRPSITTGLGLGNGGAEALLAGLYETVERDAAMLAWYSTFEPLGLAVESSSFETLARRARAEDLTVTPLLLTQDVDVPVVAVAVHREGEWPQFAVGMDADLDPAAAATAALEEALQNWVELRGMGPEGAADADGAIGRYAAFPSAARSFVDPETTIPADSVGPDEPPESDLDAVLDRLAAAGLDAYAARLTPRDVEAAGFEAVRVLVPAAQPLFTGEAYFGERARTVPEQLGFEARLDRDHHPYP